MSQAPQRNATHAEGRPAGGSAAGHLWRKIMREAEAWGASLVIHLLLLAAMAYFVLQPDETLRPLSIDSRIGEDTAPDFDALDGGPSLTELEPMPLLMETDSESLPELNFDTRGRLLDERPTLHAFDITAALDGRSGQLKQDLLRGAGGNADSERAVARGLSWLAQHQFPDGHWSLHEYAPRCRGQCDGWARFPADTGATGLALLPFLGAGHTHTKAGTYQTNVRRGLRWLTRNQRSDGSLFTGGPTNVHMYSHGIATIVLCEAYALTADSELRGPAQKAVDYIVAAQNTTDGGWRYQPRYMNSDTSVVGWQVMALQSARMAGLRVDAAPLEKVSGWLDLVAQSGGRYAYQVGDDPSLAMTAEGLLCRQYLGWPRNHPDLLAGADHLLDNLPDWNHRDVYYWYYATQVMHHLGGRHWRAWNAAMRDSLVRRQVKRGHAGGSWNPNQPRRDRYAPAGRLYVTTLSLLVLESYYRHLPLYQELPGAAGG